MAFELPPLPYAKDALAPHMSAETLEFHHDKHHRAYVDKLNELVEGTDLAGQSLEHIIRATAKDDAKAAIFDNAAQAWNHDFFWHSMKPAGGGKPSVDVIARIDRDFGSFDKFHKAFAKAAADQFGSGWVWVVLDRGKLKVTKTANADTPIAHRQTPLLACDVWEHAYYLDYRNRRADFVTVFLDLLTNWDFVDHNLAHPAGQVAA
jgi:superoxide dismutase, Fe-Mn family